MLLDSIDTSRANGAEGQHGGLAVGPLRVLQVLHQPRQGDFEYGSAVVSGDAVQGRGGAFPQVPLIFWVGTVVFVVFVDLAITEFILFVTVSIGKL